MERIIEKELSFLTLKLEISTLGKDINILVSGGSAHIGCTVLALPRPSLTGDGTLSSTSSVINVTGHKDEQVCRYIAEAICAKKNTTVVCTGGIHIDGITKEQIEELQSALVSMTNAI